MKSATQKKKKTTTKKTNLHHFKKFLICRTMNILFKNLWKRENSEVSINTLGPLNFPDIPWNKEQSRPNLWPVNGNFKNMPTWTSEMWRWSVLYARAVIHQYLNTEHTARHSEMDFLLLFNYSEICDCSVFNLNHYLLLSYSRMNKVIKRQSETWQFSPPFCSPWHASLTCKVTL